MRMSAWKDQSYEIGMIAKWLALPCRNGIKRFTNLIRTMNILDAILWTVDHGKATVVSMNSWMKAKQAAHKLTKRVCASRVIMVGRIYGVQI